MQSFRERSGGYHSNQPCYQQEPHELSRLETYRQHPHHPQPQHPHPSPGPHPGPVPGPGPGPGPGHTRTGYEALSLANPTSMPPTGGPGTGGGPKDCYSQQAYPGYPGNGGGNGSGNGGSAPSQAKKSYRPSKVPQTNTTQHLQGPGAYSNHMGPGSYSAQYISEGHLQQKWEDQAQLAQYDQELIGRMEGSGTPAPGSSQYMDQNMLGHSQTQCHQPSTPAYTSPHHQPHPPNPAQSPLMYPQSHLHYPQHSPSPSPYMEKCSPMPHCYKGYNMPTNSQYGRQMSSNINLKQGGYRPTQNSYSYQQPPSRAYEQQPPLQAMTNPQESHTKYQHYSQPQQNYCLSDLSVRSPEQYYQTCSPSSSHSPARSVGRSPSYSSTPSPLMTNPESFQYGQPPMTPGAASSSSSSSAGMQDQASTNTMLMPPRSHPSPNVPHAAPHSYTTTPQVPTMKERFSEKLLSNPSLWSLNALTSQVENISNNVQQLLLSEALVANKKGSKRSSGGSNSSVGSGASSKKGDEYKSPPYPDSGAGSVGPMQDPYSTPQHQPMPMELHEGGYSSSSDEQLERGYYYCGQGRSPAQAPNNTQQSLDTASSCSMTSPDDMSTRSGDSGLHNLTPDPTRCQSGQGGDGMSTPVKSIGDERSPTSITIPSPMKQERDSPLDIQHISEPVKENFEESAWTEKPVDKEEVTTDKNPDLDRDSDMTKSTENLEKWSDEEKCTARYSDLNKDETDKGYCYKETLYQHVQSKYDSDARDSVEQSPAALSDSSHKEHFVNEMKSEAFKSESPTASESSVKTLPFVSGGDLEQDQYSTEKDDSSENASPTPLAEVLNESNMDKRESRDEEDEEREDEEEAEEKNEEIQKQKLHTLSPPLSADEREELGEGETVSQSSTEDHMNNKNVPEKPLGDLCRRTENQSTELLIDNESAGAPSHPNPAAVTAAAGASERESAIGDTAPQPQSSLPVFSALNDKGTLQARDHIDHSDAKVLEPDSPQLPGKSILPSAPSWADTPPSPKKGDEDMEPGISCASAVTPLAKPEPVAPSAQPRAFGRKHARGRRRIMQSGDGIRRQLSLEREGEKEQEGAPSPTQKPCMSPSKTVLFTDQTDLAHQESIVSQTPKMLTDAFRSRMCTRSFNSLDSPPKVEPNVKRKPGPKPGPKPGSKPGPKPGPKPGAKPGPKPGPKPGLKPGPKPGLRPGPKPGPKPGQKPVPNEPELPLKIETTLRRKPGPKPGSKPGAKPGPKPGPKTGSKQAPKPGPKAGHKPGTKPAEILPPADTTPLKGSVGRPKGSVSKARVVQQEETTQPLTAQQSRNKKSTKASISQVNEDVKPVNQEEKKVNQEEKAPEKESKNMVLRSRKPSQEKPSKEKEKNGGENVLPQVVTEIKASDITPKTEESTLKETVTTTPKEVKNTYVPADPPALVAEPTEQSEEKTSLPLKRKPSPELSLTHTGKKKRGPKPKPKPILPDPAVLEEIVSPLVGSRRKRGSAKKASVVTTPTKDSLPNINETDITTDTPVVPPQCPTRTKVLPPRKGRGQKYEAMVQKITSPSLKKHLPIPQTDSNLTDDVTTKVLSQHALKEDETSVLIHGPEMMEGEVKSIDSRQEQYSKEETAQERKKHKISQEASRQEEVRTGSEEEVVNKEEMRQENHKAGTPQDGEADKVWSARDGPVEVKPQGKSKQQASEALSSTANNSSRTKRKRWAMVESTDASVVALEADSLIVTTPRLAKQRAIKNNHEMHLKQRRKKRKGQSLQEETEIVQEIKVEAAEQQQERVEEKVNTTESAAPLPISQDEIKEAPQVASTDHIQKPRRGRKPSTDPAKRKRSKSSTEPVPGQPLKVHKKPGPKPGMKDAIEVIEAVIRAAGCESDAKEEREKEERERGEIEKPDKQEESVVGPVVTVSDKKTEIITVKRIRRRPVYQNPKLSFCPYVRINNSRDFSSWCAIVNKPEDAVIFQRRRKKGILRMRNPFTVAKVVPQAAAMLQGPLVNTHLRDRCLTCSLCGKPANYRDLGDLCGPYYTEDSVPRKVLTTSHNESLRIGSEKTNDDNNNNNNSSNSEESGNSLKDEGECSTKKEGNTEALPQEVSSSSSSSSSRHHHWRHRRAERPEKVGQEGGPRRLTLRERFRRMKQLQSVSTGASGDQGGSGSMFQRLQVEAEAKEHWAHENCAIWTKGVIMVAGRLFGLKEAANNSTQTNCYKCQIAGASLSCCWRGCSHKYHYVCAKEIGCTFHEDDFSIKCPKHEDL